MARVADPDYRFDVLVTSTERHLLNRVRRRMDAPGGLPHFDSGLCWFVASHDDLSYSKPFDLVVVVTESPVAMPAAMGLARDLAREPQPVILLTEPNRMAPQDRQDGVLIVGAPQSDTAENLVLLAYTVLSPVLATAIADLDWSGDVLAVLSNGSHAVLVGVRAESGEAAVTALCAEIEGREESHTPWLGACGAFNSLRRVSFASYLVLLRWLQERCRHENLVAIGLAEPVEADDGVWATVLVITQPANGMGVRCFHRPQDHPS